MPKQNDLLMDISILYRSTQKYYDKHLVTLELTYAQLPILISIYENEGISMQQIALDGGYDKGTITKNVQKLVSLNYVEVKSSPKDKRAKELYTTEKTKQVMNKIYGIRRNWWKHIIKSIPNQKIDEFSDFYEDMAENAKVFADMDEYEIQFFSHQKVNLTDFEDKISTSLCTAGCNFRCPHCAKSNLIFLNENKLEIPLDDIKMYIEKRKDMLQAVCFMSPEPLMHPELELFLEYIKDLGYLVKIKTNGSYPDRLKDWLDKKLIDYVDLDVKNCPSRYGQTIGVDNFDVTLVKKSLEIIKKSKVDYEVTITLVKEFHDKKAMIEFAKWLGDVKLFILSSYLEDTNSIVDNLHGFSEEEMNEMCVLMKEYIPNTKVKGETYGTGRKA